MDIRPHKEIKESRAVDFLKVDKFIYAVGLETVKVSEKCLL